MNKNTRRNFLKTASIGTVAALALPQIVSAAFAGESLKKAGLNTDDVVLFQGDSITDWGRDHNAKDYNSNGALGSGYAFMTAGRLLDKYADKNLKIYNKGVSGNKVYQLAERWDNDCLDLKPNVLSIHIGVNDFWHTLSGGYKGTVETYITDYHKLLDRTKRALPDVKLIICEPFALKRWMINGTLHSIHTAKPHGISPQNTAQRLFHYRKYLIKHWRCSRRLTGASMAYIRR